MEIGEHFAFPFFHCIAFGQSGLLIRTLFLELCKCCDLSADDLL